jgi:DNA-directed RNA polymerase specialized sigma24 family protein
MLSVQSLIREAGTTGRTRGRAARAAEDPRLHEAISGLPDPQRLALALRYYESMPVAAIAAVLDLDEGATRALLVAAAGAVTERLRGAATERPRPRRGARA